MSSTSRDERSEHAKQGAEKRHLNANVKCQTQKQATFDSLHLSILHSGCVLQQPAEVDARQLRVRGV
jgi:hypothetical protein